MILSGAKTIFLLLPLHQNFKIVVKFIGWCYSLSNNGKCISFCGFSTIRVTLMTKPYLPSTPLWHLCVLSRIWSSSSDVKSVDPTLVRSKVAIMVVPIP